MKKILPLILLLTIYVGMKGQHSFAFHGHNIEIGGYIIAYYQQRFPYPGYPKMDDNSKNTFVLDDARLEIKGYHKGRFRYTLGLNFADFAKLAINGVKSINNPPVTEAHIRYINNIVNVKAGYMKLPFSQSSNMDKVPSPFMQRAAIANEDYYSRRDVGLMLYKDFWQQRIQIYGGIFSGMGEQILLGENDPSGKPEYAGRVELSSTHYKEEELDWNDLVLPCVRVGGNVRYAEKRSFTGTGDEAFTLENAKTIDGKKLTYGMDAAIMWRGFSAQFEMAQARLSPRNNTPLYNQLALYNTDFYRNGGFLVQVNYYNRKLLSAFALRYDEFNPSDLIQGNTQRSLSVGYNFIYHPYKMTFKVHYAYRFKQQDNNTKWNRDQLRVAVQYEF